jgi:hypothetical protein
MGIFVTVASSHLWQIFSFIVHPLLASKEPEDALNHQQQVVLRNTGSAVTLSWHFTRLAYAWRSTAQRSFLRCAPFATLAFIYAIAAGGAVILSSRIAKSSSHERLVVASPNCGEWSWLDTAPRVSVLSMDRKYQQDTREAAEYARACYPP